MFYSSWNDARYSFDLCRKNDFNFGDWINNGVTYTDSRGEVYARKRFGLEEAVEGEEKPEKRLVSLSNQSDIDLMGGVFAKLESFLENTEEEIFQFDHCNGFLRRYIYEQVELRYVDSLVLKKNENSILCAYKINKESKLEFDRKKKEEDLVKFKNMIGFRQVFNALVELKKPIVGHNLLFDLMFVHRWLDSELPEDFATFKNKLNANFNLVFDTKFVDSSGVLGVGHSDTTLEQCMTRYKVDKACEVKVNEDEMDEVGVTGQKPPSIDVLISSDCDFDPEATCFHNAGYDAYCTGYVFAQQLELFTSTFTQKYEGSLDENGVDASNWNQNIRSLAFDSFCQSCVNKTFMMQSLFHMNLDGAIDVDVPKYPGSIFRITDFPRQVQTEDVLKSCSTAVANAGVEVPDLDTTVVWVDDKSFFVVVNEPRLTDTELTKAVVDGLSALKWTVQNYHEYMQGLLNPVEDEKIPVEAPVPVLTKRGSWMSSWMTNIFKSSCCVDEEEDESASTTESRKKRVRVD